MGTGHLIFGNTTDYITGRTIPDTHDERIRQTLSRLLIDAKGFEKSNIQTRQSMKVTVDQKTGFVFVDFVIKLNDKICMMMMYGPGSLVTRQRPTLAAARLFRDYVIPFAVITNGKDAIIMDAVSGKTIAEGLAAIPSKKQLLEKINHVDYARIPESQREKEKRILFVMDVLTHQECSDYICSL